MKQLRFCLVAAIPLLFMAPAASAQNGYPNKAVRIVVGYQAGGPTDMAARLLASKLQDAMGQAFVVENKPGAGSNLASELVSAATPDGYTLLYAAAPIVVNGFLYKRLRWKVDQNFEPISLIMSAPGVLAVSPNVPARNLDELIALARQQPGKLTFASTGNGGTQHLAGELLKQRAGIDIIHVPYKGAAGALTDLMAGQVTMAFVTSVGAMPYLKDGKIRPIAVASPMRLAQLPDVPTMSEAGLPGFESDSWNGLLAPKGTPAEVIAKLSAEIRKAVSSGDLRDSLERQGAVLVGDAPDEFKSRIRQDMDHWGNFLKTVPVRLD